MVTIEERIKRVGLNIAYYRKYRNLTQQQLSELTGLSRTHISNIEAVGMSKSVSLEAILKIADALKIPAKYLFDFEEVV